MVEKSVWDEVETYVWDEGSFLRAWEAGAFGDVRVELVEGKVIRVVIGMWHARVVGRVARLVWRDGWEVLLGTLPSSGSLPDPDAFVTRENAEPTRLVGTATKIAHWDPADIALVVEVSDSSFLYDTTVKADLYARSGFSTYWVVHRRGVEVFTEPSDEGYRNRRSVRPNEDVALPYAPTEALAVADILDVRDA